MLLAADPQTRIEHPPIDRCSIDKTATRTVEPAFLDKKAYNLIGVMLRCKEVHDLFFRRYSYSKQSKMITDAGPDPKSNHRNTAAELERYSRDVLAAPRHTENTSNQRQVMHEYIPSYIVARLNGFSGNGITVFFKPLGKDAASPRRIKFRRLDDPFDDHSFRFNRNGNMKNFGRRIIEPVYCSGEPKGPLLAQLTYRSPAFDEDVIRSKGYKKLSNPVADLDMYMAGYSTDLSWSGGHAIHRFPPSRPPESYVADASY
jgi:hypothetical protein